MKKATVKNLCPTNYLMILSPLYLFFSVIHISGYRPTENIAVDCGKSTPSTAPDGRNWVADIDSELFTLEQLNNNASVTSSAQEPRTISVPYSTVRISSSEFTYVFRLTSGPKFVRLYFYSSYQNFDRSKAFFSVKANHFTLLSNASAYSLGLQTAPKEIFLEFFLNIEEVQKNLLNITFTPSITPTNSYAFINGIEIVSMATDLYYGSGQPEGFTFVGYPGKLYQLLNNTAAETIYRLNVGGKSISPEYDTGMFRRWSQDDEYVSIIGALPVNWTIKLSFTQKPNYTAPEEVYRTARSMGNNGTQNEGYNLTWALPVDSDFTYMLRLHFCEFQPQVTKPGDRVFRIFMANQTAEDEADVITWSEKNGVPFYRDYAVIVSPGGEKKKNLSLALHPGLRTRYSDAILNGLEVFKLSDPAGNLAGNNPDPPPPPPTVPSSTQPRKPKSKQTTTLIAAICSCVVAVSVTVFLIFRRRRRVNKDSGGSSHGGPSWWGSLPYVSVKPTTKTSGSSLPSDVCRQFSLAEIRAATKNFDGVFIIGRGGFGDVYKGNIDGGATPVAIKRLKPGSQQGAHEFMTEIEMLSQLRHLHLVSLIGYCNDDREMILVYDYMSRGTLRDHLYDTDNPPLSWNQRLQICIGAAKGLHYLHTGAKRMIIHRDVKTTNILLDDKWVAKVSDFGLSKINPNNTFNTHISTVVKGSFGYLDPEYYRRQQLTEKSDVYSFGVVLFEVLCARPPLDQRLERNQVSLAGWARMCYQKGRLGQIVDQNLMGQIAPECLKKFGEVAVSCLHDVGIERPSMSDVVWALEFALQLQETAEEEIKLGEAHEEHKDEDALPFNGVDELMVSSGGGRVSSSGVTMTSNSETSFTSSGSEDRLSSRAVFSEITNPKPR